MQQLETTINKNDVIISMKKYKNNILDDETVNKLLKSEENIENGRTRNATEVIQELRTKYGF